MKTSLTAPVSRRTFLPITAALFLGAFFMGLARAQTGGLTNEVWIAIRTDGITGTGTFADPFDGSTAAKFDSAILATPSNTLIHIGPGTFLTNGFAGDDVDWPAPWAGVLPPISNGGFYLKSGQKLQGAGMYVTTLKLAAWPQHNGGPITWSHVVIGNLVVASLNDNIQVSDLTVDGNWTGLYGTPNGPDIQRALAAVNLAGSGMKISRVRAIHCHGHDEAFVVAIVGVYTNNWFLANGYPKLTSDASGAVIEDCVIDQWIGGHAAGCGGGFVIFTTGSNAGIGAGGGDGAIRNCSAYNMALCTSAYGGSGHVTIENNYAIGCQQGAHFDTCYLRSLDMHGNRFVGCTAQAIAIYGADQVGMDIYGNFLDVNRTNNANPWDLYINGSGGNPTSVRFNGNTLTWSGSGNVASGINVAGVTNFVAQNNYILSSMTNSIAGSTNTYLANNVTETGGVPAGLTPNTSNNTAPVVTLTGSNPLVFEAGTAYTDPGATAIDAQDGALTLVNTGNTVMANLPGSYLVSWSATDSMGLTGSASRTVNVVDTTPPVITVPANISAHATTAGGAVVNFTTCATDLVSGTVPTTSNPASGTVFSIGTTTVTTIATDTAGNTAAKTFTVTVTVPPITDREKAAPQIAVSNGTVNLTVKPSVPGRSYQLQLSDDLSGGSWQNWGSVQTGTGNDLVISIPYDPVVPRRFYRLRLNQSG